MKEKPYQDITIKEISDRALLSRRTYYRNFNNKDEILYLHMNKVFEEYVTKLSMEGDITLSYFSNTYFQFCYDNLDYLLLLKKNNLLYLLLQKYDEYLPIIFKKFRGHLNLYKDQEHLEYALSFNTGGYWYILIKWLSDGAKKTPQEMTQMVQDSLTNLYKFM